MKNLGLHGMAVALAITCSSHAWGVTQFIGDADGFGYGNAEGYVGADGNPAQRSGDPSILDMGDVLPDLDGDGKVYYLSNDDFDFRSQDERVNLNNDGAQWTDVALSINYAARPVVTDAAIFTFRFTPPSPGDEDYGLDHFFNLVYADYEAEPMTIELEGQTINLLGNEEGGTDAYIWRAYATVKWDDIKDGEVTARVTAEKEPYVAFDYAYLGSKPLVIPQDPPSGALSILLLK